MQKGKRKRPKSQSLSKYLPKMKSFKTHKEIWINKGWMPHPNSSHNTSHFWNSYMTTLKFSRRHFLNKRILNCYGKLSIKSNLFCKEAANSWSIHLLTVIDNINIRNILKGRNNLFLYTIILCRCKKAPTVNL